MSTVLILAIVQSMLSVLSALTGTGVSVTMGTLAILITEDVIQVGHIGHHLKLFYYFENILVPEPQPECRVDADCPSRQACLNEVCRNPCLVLSPCGQNAECTVQNTLPQRTMICMCIPGYVGDADIACNLRKTNIILGLTNNQTGFSFNLITPKTRKAYQWCIIVCDVSTRFILLTIYYNYSTTTAIWLQL